MSWLLKIMHAKLRSTTTRSTRLRNAFISWGCPPCSIFKQKQLHYFTQRTAETNLITQLQDLWLSFRLESGTQCSDSNKTWHQEAKKIIKSNFNLVRLDHSHIRMKRGGKTIYIISSQFLLKLLSEFEIRNEYIQETSLRNMNCYCVLNIDRKILKPWHRPKPYFLPEKSSKI